MSDEILVLGKIQGARGVRGELRVIRRGDLLDGFKKNTTIELYSAEGIQDGFLIKPVFFSEQIMENFAVLTPDTVQLKFKDINTADDAWKLKGVFIGMKLSEAKKKFHNHDDPYLFEYIGLEVFERNDNDALIGRVSRVDEYNRKQWLIVDGCEVMIPLQGPFIEKVDFKLGRIYIVAESGLFTPDESA
jgi:16S rRNA processing protein RimM